ncbi:MAG: Regulatory protein recX [Labilithrix sp.]|jgi:regulatory protein|nr:Regulatory protein recX [Labilithrix sp.]
MFEPRITRIEPLPPKGLRVVVHLDHGDPLEVTLEALELSRLGVGDPLTADARAALLDLDADVRVREAALGLIAHRARTRQELARKLRRKGFRAERIDACLSRLEEKGLMDDAAVAAAVVRDRLRHRPRGEARLVSELRAKGIERDVASATIAQVFADEEVSDTALAREAAAAWLSRQRASVRDALGDRGSLDRDKARRRLYGYLARRGFGGDALGAAMDHAEQLTRG